MGGLDTFGGKQPTMASHTSKSRRNGLHLVPFRALGIVLVLQLVGCLIISLYYLRAANQEIVWLVKALYDQETTRSDAMRRFTLTGSKSQELDRLISQHRQVTAEVDALQKQLLDLRKENEDLRGHQDELNRQADVLRHKAEELNVERGRLSGELTQALRRVQAAEDGNVRNGVASTPNMTTPSQGPMQQELQVAQAELARLRVGGKADAGDPRLQGYVAFASRVLEVLGVLASDVAPQQATIAKAHAGLQQELQAVATGVGRVQVQAGAAHDPRQDGVMDINKDA